MSIEHYYSSIHTDFLSDLFEGVSAPHMERLVEYTYIPDQTDEDYQEAARVEIHAVWIVRHLSSDLWQQSDIIDILTDEEITRLEAETLRHRESVRVRRLRSA